MKIITPLLITIAATAVGVAQEFPYAMTQATSTWTSVTDYIVSHAGSDILQAPIAIGRSNGNFPTFQFRGLRVDSIIAYPRGAVALYAEENRWVGQLAVLMSDYVSRTTFDPNDMSSEFGIAINGVVPDRILKIQWKNLQLSGRTSAHDDSINYQLWLYEGTNIIEVHAGPSHAPGPFTNFDEPIAGPILAIYDPENFAGYEYYGAPSSPTRGTWPGPFNGLNAFPADGTVYRFAYSSSSLKTDAATRATTVTAHPNPATLSTTIRFDLARAGECELRLHDALGIERRRTRLGRLDTGQLSVSVRLDGLSAGVYVYTVVAADMVASGRVVVW